MGGGNYDFEAHQAITQTQRSAPIEQVFKQSRCHASMNPHGVKFRESRDSANHPNSLAIMLACDVTGSMSGIPKYLATDAFPHFMQTLLDLGIVDPQVMFAAVGDCHGDDAPLQVGQFESAATELNQWLTCMFLEGGGGGREGSLPSHESYDLPMHFAGTHTSIDCWEKRGKKGFFLMTGDEMPYAACERYARSRIIGEDATHDLTMQEVVAQLTKTYHLFFIIPDKRRAKVCEKSWRSLIGDHTIVVSGQDDIVYAAAGAIALTEGTIADVMVLGAELERLNVDHKIVVNVTQALTPYAASLGRDRAPQPRSKSVHP